MILKAEREYLSQAAVLADELFPGHAPGELLAEWAALPPGELALGEARRDYVEGTQTSPVGYLEGIYVREQYRGRGQARALLRACEDWAAERGCGEFASDCQLENTDSIAFHLGAGFAEANRIVCFVKPL